MTKVGYSPSVRLFEAAACAAPIISDHWPGIESFFVPGREILLAEGPKEVLGFLTDISEQERSNIASRALERVLRDHTSARRAQELEEILQQVTVLKECGVKLVN
jgi:spore maturation protein CgeB